MALESVHPQNNVEAESRRLAAALTNIQQAAPDSLEPSSSASLPITYFDPSSPIANLTGNLPHWRQDGTTYFVTFRLADSLPVEKLDQWRQEHTHWLGRNPIPHTPAQREEYFDKFPRRLQSWLDAGYGSRVLKIPEVKQLTREALCFFDGQRYQLHEFSVASNHVHAIVTPLSRFELSQILHSWKSFTAHRILKMESACQRLQKTLGKASGPGSDQRSKLSVWQKESFDHIVRSPESLTKFRAYIRAHDSNG